MRRKEGNHESAGYGSRAAGIILVAFFALGVATGLSERGRDIAHRASSALKPRMSVVADVRTRVHDALDYVREVIDALELALGFAESSAHAAARAPKYSSAELEGKAVALVSRGDGFYALLSTGELRGPISPSAGEDLPILSGAGITNALGGQLVEYAALMVRAEADLSHMISEMRVADDGTASLFLDNSPTEVVIDLNGAQLEMRRAAEVLHRFLGREHHVAVLDMTTPGQAVVRLTTPFVTSARSAGPVEPAAAKTTAPWRSAPLIARSP
ncbi:MAG: cell division protein FtsQ/DivIB [Candidatus Binataceae bacterium]